MKISDILQGVIEFDELSALLDSKSVFDAKNLKEDMLQVSYGKILLDVGWYPAFNPKGKFHIVAIKDFNWQEPLISEYATPKNILEKIKKFEEIIIKSINEI